MTIAAPPRWTAGVRREVLPNGLTVLVQRDPSAPAVAVVTHVRAGFFDEPDRWQGISHVLEHMFFKGTPRRGVGAIARETKGAGGYLNASTSYDRTEYYVVLPARNLAQALDIQSDALRNSTIDAGELARELQVIIQEAGRKLDSSGAVAYETLHEVMFDVHRIRRWRIGYADQLARFTREDVLGYYRSRYVPSRTIVAIVGDVDPDAAIDLARGVYGEWPAAGGAQDPSPEEPARTGVRARTLRGDVAQADLVLGWRTVPPLHPDSGALELAATILGAGRGSWLYRRLREPGIVTDIAAHNYAPTELGTFTITAELEPERVADAVRGIAESVTRLAMSGPEPEDMARSRALVRARWARRMEQMEGRASSLAMAEALGGVDVLEREYEAVETTTADEVREAVARWLVPGDAAGVAYLPEGRGVDLTDAGLAEAFALTALLPAPAESFAFPVPPEARHHAGARRLHPPSGVLHLPLDGVDLLVRRKEGVPLATLALYAPRAEQDPPALGGLGALATRAALRGAGDLDAAALAFAFERLGGTLSPSSARDWAGFATSVLADGLPSAAALLRLVFAEPRLDDAAIEIERGLLISEAQQVSDDMLRFPFQLAYAAAFGDRDYGVPLGGQPGTLAAISAADVRGWHRSAMLGVRPVVVAVGDFDPELAADQLAAEFAALPARPAPGRLGPYPWAPASGGPIARMVERDKAQSAIAMVFPGPARRAADRSAADVWAAVASGLGGRLFDALRERRSLAYTVLASSWQRGRAGALVTYIATSPEREAEARESMLAELAVFTREPPSSDELTQAVEYLAGQEEVHRQSGGAVAGEILEAWVIGDGLDELADPAGRFRRVTADSVRGVAARYLDPERRAEGVVRGCPTGRPSPTFTQG